MKESVCRQCSNQEVRAGAKVCFKKGKSMKECLNFYPDFGTPMFLKFMRKGKLTQASRAQAVAYVENQTQKFAGVTA